MKGKKDNGVTQKNAMQTRVSNLRETLKLLQPVVPRKPNLEALKNVLLADGKAMANNLDVMVAIDYPEAQGRFIIPHQNVQELLKFVPGNELLTIEQDKKHLRLSWESGKASYDVAEPADYPSQPKVAEKTTVNFDGDRLIAAMMSVVDYCATEETRPILGCVNLSLGENTDIAAADGFRMAYQVIPVVSPVQDSMNIPASSVRILGGLWNKLPPAVPPEKTLARQVMSKRQIKLVRGDDMLLAQFGHVTLAAHLTRGEFPSYRKLIPDNPPINVRFFAPELKRAVMSVKMISKDVSGRVNLEWTENCLTVFAASSDKGEAETKLKVQADSPGRISINEHYLLEYLGDKEGLVSIGVTTPQSPVLLRHGNSPIVVIMPMNTPSSSK